MWIIYFGHYGFVGLVTWTAVMLLPLLLFLRRFPVQQWRTPTVGPLAVMAVLLGLYQIDCLVNGFLNPVLLVASGGVICVLLPVPMRRSWPQGSLKTNRSTKLHHTSLWNDNDRDDTAMIEGHRVEMATTELPSRGTTPQEHLAERYQQLAKTLKNQGLSAEAKTAWTHALELLTNVSSACPEFPDIQKRRWDCVNDFAWFLLNELDPAVRNPAMSIQLATQATEMDPHCATYWNTLGAAYYCEGDSVKAIPALERSMALSNGGTAFDFIFLALAHDRLGHQEQAQFWNTQAGLWMEQHDFHHPDLSRLRDQSSLALSSHTELSSLGRE